MGQLVIVRHGQASLFSADYDQLSDKGREQSRALGAYWGRISRSFDAVVTGPAKRHRDTGELAGQALIEAGGSWSTPEVIPGLNEHDAFALVGKAAPLLRENEQIAPLQRELATAKTRPERGRGFQRLFEAIMSLWLRDELPLDDIESWADFSKRVDEATDVLAKQSSGRTIVVFTSVGPLAVMLRRALCTSDQRSFETAWRIRNASVTEFVASGGRFTLDRFNAIPHLPEASMQTFR